MAAPAGVAVAAERPVRGPAAVQNPKSVQERTAAKAALTFSTKDGDSSHPSADPRVLLAKNGGPTRPAAWVFTIEDILERSGAEVANPLPRREMSEAAEAASASDVFARDGISMGDADGDGRSDVAILEFADGEFAYGTELIIARGTDGADLTRVDLDADLALALAPGDLTGDGRADVLTLAVRVADFAFGGCAVFACAITDKSTWVWKTQLISGADGSSVWSAETPGKVDALVAFAFAPFVGIAITQFVDASALLVMPFIGSDRNADGSADVVVNTVDVDSDIALAFLFPAFLWYVDEASATTASILSGRDGAALAEPQTTGMQNGFSWLVPAGQSVGSAYPDLMWHDYLWRKPELACAGVVFGLCFYDFSTRARLVDGSTLTTEWEDHSLRAEYSPLSDDLNGDGFDEVLVAERWGSDVAVLNGSTGGPLWSRNAEAAIVVGSLDGGEAQDIVTARADYAPDESVDLILDRIDGGTGTVISSTTRPVYATDGYVYGVLNPVGDSDGDGVVDIGLMVERGHFESDASTTVGYVESSRTGETVVTTAEISGWAASLSDGGDLDGDGSDDVLMSTFYWGSNGDSLDLLGAGSGGTFWTRSHRFDWLSDFRLSAAGNLASAPGDDALLTWNAFDFADGRRPSGIDAIAGTSGATLWTAGDSLLAAPDRSTIAGDIVDSDGDSVSAVCVAAFDADETVVRRVFTSTGAFELGVIPGEYRLRVEDCFGHYDGTRTWYELKDSFEEADPVLATAGNTTEIEVTYPVDVVSPPNDDLADAIPLRLGSYSTTTVGAGTEEGEPAPCGRIGATVWFTYTPVVPGTVALTTSGSSFDTVLAAYTGTDMANLSNLDCDDDSMPDLTSALVLTVEAGETYLIQAGGYDGDFGDLVLTATAI